MAPQAVERRKQTTGVVRRESGIIFGIDLYRTFIIHLRPTAMMDYNVQVSQTRRDDQGSVRLSIEVAMVIAAFVGFAVVLALAAKIF